MSMVESFYGSGSRKSASARVFLIPLKTGSGKFTVNKKDIGDYFPELAAVDTVYQPLTLLGMKDFLNQYHIKVTVKGGGKSGQRDAIRLGLAKALVMLSQQQCVENGSSEEGEGDNSWRRQLRKAALLTTDSRQVESKKYGLHKARKRAPLVKR